MTALKTLTIMKQTLAGWHTRTGGTKKDTCRCTFKKKKKKWRAMTPHSPLMSHWKGGMCQLSFVTAHLRFKHCNRLPPLPNPSPRGGGGGLTSAFCFHSLQNTKVGRKKKKKKIQFPESLSDSTSWVLSNHSIGWLLSFLSFLCAAFISSNSWSSQKDATCLMAWRTSTDSIRPTHPSFPTTPPSSLGDNQGSALTQPGSSIMNLMDLVSVTKKRLHGAPDWLW